MARRDIMRAQKKFTSEAKYFQLRLPSEAQERIGGIESCLWEKMDEKALNSESKRIEDRIMDPRNKADRLGLYERTVALFWVRKKHMGHVLWERMEKEEGDATPIQS